MKWLFHPWNVMRFSAWSQKKHVPNAFNCLVNEIYRYILTNTTIEYVGIYLSKYKYIYIYYFYNLPKWIECTHPMLVYKWMVPFQSGEPAKRYFSLPLFIYDLLRSTRSNMVWLNICWEIWAPFLQKHESWKHGSKRDKRRFVYKQVGNISTEQIDHAWEGKWNNAFFFPWRDGLKDWNIFSLQDL